MIIDLHNVQFAYPETPHKNTLDIHRWSVLDNEHVLVHGPSGGGKSTLLNLLSGVLRSSQGEVSVMGHRLDKMSNRQRDKFRANHIGYVFQQFNLIPYLTAEDNIKLASHFSQCERTVSLSQAIEELLSLLNIPSSAWQMPAAKLSIGQQQRIAIARALINQPKLLIADEPTSSLDQDNRDNFMALLMSLVEKQQTTLVFVSHDLQLAQYFKRTDALSDITVESSRCL